MTDDTVARFTALVERKDSIQARFIREGLESLGPDERDEFGAYLAYRLRQDETPEGLADAYLALVDSVMGEQLHFARTGRYRHAALAEVEGQVYANQEYMRRYVLGIALSLFLWPQHIGIKRFFRECFPQRNGGSYLEIGPGHGMFFLHALRRNVFARHVGVDISPASIETTRRLLESGEFGRFTGYELVNADFLAFVPERPFSACVLGEVLEHVEDPQRFLDKIADCVDDGAFVFVSTCMNAPVIDHIFNFSGPDELDAMFARAGLRARERRFFPHAGKSAEQCLARRLPLSVAYSLAKGSSGGAGG